MITLPSSPNFRDIGGYRTNDGRQVRRGLLFRSGGFHRLSPREIDQIVSYGFKLRCDLRSALERKNSPSLWPDNEHEKTVLELDMGADPRAGNKEFFDELVSDFSVTGAFNAMCTLQRHMPALIRPNLALLFDHLIDEARLPAVIHCHHGKDRTGFVVAVILLGLGVSRHDVLKDYELSNVLCDRQEMADAMRQTILKHTHKAPSNALIDQLSAAHPAYLISGLEQIERDYGDIPRFLETTVGPDTTQLDRLRDIMLEDVSNSDVPSPIHPEGDTWH